MDGQIARMRQVLKEYWGHDAFRPLQEDIIGHVLAGGDTLALLPTGGGKSICFQVPGILLGGTTIVISPLISLMNDQVENLKQRGIPAVALTSAMHPREIDVALTNALAGHVRFLYVSPERLAGEGFLHRLSHLPVTLLAVDEAHCISQWGYDFRPSYLQVCEIRKAFPAVPVIALTASATKEVVDDIMARLQFRKGAVFRQTFARANLRYVVQKEEARMERLMKLIRNLGGSGIVYVRNRKKTEALAAALSRNGVSARSYHAGMKYRDREEVQQGWIANRTQVICATNAFGMGIDKPDVRFVVHLDLPDSLEAYFQEAGRAGRDGNIAYCTIFFTAADHDRLMENFGKAFPGIEEIRRCYDAVCNYFQVAIGAGNGSTFEFDIERICKSYNLSPLLLFNSVKFLEKEGYLSSVDTGFEPSRLMITTSKENLYEYQLVNPRFEPLIKTVLRSYGGLFEGYVHISEKDIAYRVKLSEAQVTEMLGRLQQEDVMSYQRQGGLPRLVFTQDRIGSRYLQLDPANYQWLKDRALERLRSVISYTGNNAVCRQVQLLAYFNEFDFHDCGHCDVCIDRRPPEFAGVREQLVHLLSTGPLTLEQLRARMSSRDETWVKAFNQLVDDGLVREAGDRYAMRHPNP